METQTPARHCRVALAMFLVVGLVGCDSVYTIHSIDEPSGEPSAVPDLSGLWAPSDAASTSAVLRIAADDFDNGHCRNADIRLLGSSSQEWDQPFGDQVCFVPIAGHLIAQFRTTGQVQLYQQYLFKFDQESISFCDAIWSELLEWAEDHPATSAMHGVEFERRGWEDGTQLFVTSSSEVLRGYIAARLPKLARACDGDDEDSPQWATYTRMTPPRQEVDPSQAASHGD